MNKEIIDLRFTCYKCNKVSCDMYSLKGTKLGKGHYSFKYCYTCWDLLKELIKDFIRPERSKREDSIDPKCIEMRCSEHCGKRSED